MDLSSAMIYHEEIQTRESLELDVEYLLLNDRIFLLSDYMSKDMTNWTISVSVRDACYIWHKWSGDWLIEVRYFEHQLRTSMSGSKISS